MARPIALLAFVLFPLLMAMPVAARSLDDAQRRALADYGYDCGQLRNTFDVVVCSDPILLDVMGELFASYRGLRAITAASARGDLWRRQEQWIDSLTEACGLGTLKGLTGDDLDRARLCLGRGMAARVEALDVAVRLGGVDYLSADLAGPDATDQASAGRVRCTAPDGAVVMLERQTCDALGGVTADAGGPRPSMKEMPAQQPDAPPLDDGLTWQDVQSGVAAVDPATKAYQVLKYLYCRRCR
ncbi:hypothetical protein [Zavarzinia sp. CC-PAN008]|uniref:hypothetical protein n=1 Tax=Zavarzinia sp. CC-PAN008 TaxID=3243332 RepID=UPI003F748B99